MTESARLRLVIVGLLLLVAALTVANVEDSANAATKVTATTAVEDPSCKRPNVAISVATVNCRLVNADWIAIGIGSLLADDYKPIIHRVVLSLICDREHRGDAFRIKGEISFRVNSDENADYYELLQKHDECQLTVTVRKLSGTEQLLGVVAWGRDNEKRSRSATIKL